MTEHESLEAAQEAAAGAKKVATDQSNNNNNNNNNNNPPTPLSSLEPLPSPPTTSHYHHHHRTLTKFAIRAGAIVDGITVTYSNGVCTQVGGTGGGDTTLELLPNEVINLVEIRYNPSSFVQCLTLHTSQGRKLGPCGGNGGIFLGGIGGGTEVVVKAPHGTGLVGVYGREGKYLDAIGFYWGHVSMDGDENHNNHDESAVHESTVATTSSTGSSNIDDLFAGDDHTHPESQPPPPLTIEKTECFGGTGGGPFDDRESSWLATRSLDHW